MFSTVRCVSCPTKGGRYRMSFSLRSSSRKSSNRTRACDNQYPLCLTAQRQCNAYIHTRQNAEVVLSELSGSNPVPGPPSLHEILRKTVSRVRLETTYILLTQTISPPHSHVRDSSKLNARLANATSTERINRTRCVQAID